MNDATRALLTYFRRHLAANSTLNTHAESVTVGTLIAHLT